jgi:hypothetical protein
MFKMIILGAIGYAAYRFINQQPAQPDSIRLAGGPLSDKAVLQHEPTAPPVA